MKKLFFQIVLFIIINFCISVNINAQNPLWTTGTAITVRKNILELNIFEPARYGITKRWEVSSHPVGFFVMPHIFTKYMWTQKVLFKKKFIISSQHGFYYPTWALNLVRNKGISDYLPLDTKIPHILAFRNELLISHYINEPNHCEAGNNLLTLRLGVKYSLTKGESTPPIIYQSILYRETMVFSPKPVIYLGVDLDATLNSMFNYFVDLEFHSIGFIPKYWAVESKAGIVGYTGKRVRAFVGAKFAYSKIPGDSKFSMIPIGDISWSFRIKKNRAKEHGLFAPGILNTQDFARDSKDIENDVIRQDSVIIDRENRRK